MSPLQAIRKRLGVTQTQLAASLGVTQGNVSFYENGQTIPPAVAARLIDVAKSAGHDIGFDHVYGRVELPSLSGAAQQGA